MAQRHAGREVVEGEIAALGRLPLSDLRERWRELFGTPPPKSLRREFLIKACAYQIQVTAFGGLSAGTKRRLQAIADAARKGTSAASPKIKLGTRLIRSWGGKVHTVTAVEHGFEYDGRQYLSLSAIARAITGTNWNGHVFFGVKRQGGAAPTAMAKAGKRRKADHGPAGAERSAAARANVSQPARRRTMPPPLLAPSLPTELIDG